jgi:hypothetical protein
MAVVRDIAVILLAVEAFVLALVPLALLGGLVYGLAWLQRRDNLPSWLRLGQAYVSLGQGYVHWLMALLVRPVFWLHQAAATLQRWLGGGLQPRR